jgi:hypothetical protein
MVKAPDLEHALLILPFHYVGRFISMLLELIQQGLELELCTRCAVFLLRCHQAQIISTASLLQEMLALKHIIRESVGDYRDLLGKYGKNYLLSLQELKRKKIIKKIGISVYDSQEIQKIWKFWKPDLIQVPFNPLDNRILDSGWVDILKKFKVKIFVRSIFLQGLLINERNSFIINNLVLIGSGTAS